MPINHKDNTDVLKVPYTKPIQVKGGDALSDYSPTYIGKQPSISMSTGSNNTFIGEKPICQ